jgi:hypothetical protein
MQFHSNTYKPSYKKDAAFQKDNWLQTKIVSIKKCRLKRHFQIILVLSKNRQKALKNI